METGYIRPIHVNSSSEVSDDVAGAQLKLAGKRKLARIIKSMPTLEQHVKVGRTIEIYQKSSMDKRGVWSVPKIILEVNYDACLVVVSGKAGRKVTVASEYARKAVPKDSFAHSAQQAIDSTE